MRGLLGVGMIAHGLWDVSVFLPAPTGTLALVNLAIQVLVFVAAVIAAIVLVRRDRRTAVTSTGTLTLWPAEGRPATLATITAVPTAASRGASWHMW